VHIKVLMQTAILNKKLMKTKFNAVKDYLNKWNKSYNWLYRNVKDGIL